MADLAAPATIRLQASAWHFPIEYPNARVDLRFSADLLLAQSSTPPRKSVAVDNTVTGTNSARNGASQKGKGGPKSPPVAEATEEGSDTSKQAAESGPSAKPPEKDPDPIVRYTLLLVIVGALQVLAMVVQSVFLYGALREIAKATELTRQSIVLSHRPS